MLLVHVLIKYALSQTTFVSLINLEMEFVKIIITDLFVTLIWVTVVSVSQMIITMRNFSLTVAHAVVMLMEAPLIITQFLVNTIGDDKCGHGKIVFCSPMPTITHLY